MTNSQAGIFEQLFGKSIQDASCAEMLKQIVKKYPYFTPAHFFLLQQMDKQDSNYKKQAATTALLFNNVHWLHFQLTQKNNIAKTSLTKEENNCGTINSSTQENAAITSTNMLNEKKQSADFHPTLNTTAPADDTLIFEPLFATDYFASQGIKLSEDIQPNDKLGKQLKSFTDWLKTMKKVHTEKLASDNGITDIAVQKLAEKSNTDEEILTEAMAEVFAKQNKINKAIEVYEKLSLLNPSKSAYFAGKIEHLKAI
jgi:hypothetical protein